MKYIVAGGRDFTDGRVLKKVLDTFTDIEIIISGDARGADFLGTIYATEKDIPVKHFPAKWEEYGKSAGFIRNAEMGDYGDALIAFWDGASKGTKHMIQTIKRKNKPYWIFNYQGNLIESSENI